MLKLKKKAKKRRKKLCLYVNPHMPLTHNHDGVCVCVLCTTVYLSE
jgi:hypothetical protein